MQCIFDGPQHFGRKIVVVVGDTNVVVVVGADSVVIVGIAGISTTVVEVDGCGCAPTIGVGPRTVVDGCVGIVIVGTGASVVGVIDVSVVVGAVVGTGTCTADRASSSENATVNVMVVPTVRINIASLYCTNFVPTFFKSSISTLITQLKEWLHC